MRVCAPLSRMFATKSANGFLRCSLSEKTSFAPGTSVEEMVARFGLAEPTADGKRYQFYDASKKAAYKLPPSALGQEVRAELAAFNLAPELTEAVAREQMLSADRHLRLSEVPALEAIVDRMQESLRPEDLDRVRSGDLAPLAEQVRDPALRAAVAYELRNEETWARPARSGIGPIWRAASQERRISVSARADSSAIKPTNSKGHSAMLSNLETAWRYPLAVALGLVTGLYIGSMLATIYIIVAFRENLDTLSPLGLWFFRYPWADLEARPATLQGALIITGAVTIALTLVGLAGVHRGRLNQCDDAHFQTKRELKRNKMIGSLDQNGFIFGKLGSPKSDAPFVMAPPDRFPHAMMIAPTGRGKGVGFVIPNLLHFTGSGIILDVKGENFAKTSIHRQHGLKNAIWYFSPFDDERGSHRFNPLARIAALPSAERQYTALNSMADLFLIPEGESAQSFFNAGKRLFIASCLYAIEKRRPTVGYAGEIMAGGGDKKKTYTTIAEDTQIPIVSRTFLEMADVPEKTLGAYVSVIQGSGLELWNDPAVDRVTSASDFDFSTFRAKPQSLYIVVQPEHLKTLAPAGAVSIRGCHCFAAAQEPGPDEPHAVMFLMDEFDQLGRQPLVTVIDQDRPQFWGAVLHHLADDSRSG